jgi:hypothetical protein
LRLGEIERERSQFVESLAASIDLDRRFESAIAREHAWISAQPGIPLQPSWSA